MSNTANLLRSLLIFGLCLPLAAFLGYLLATPLDPTTLMVVGMTLVLLLVPVLLRSYHILLVASWNMTAVVFFFPGRPQLWMTLVAVSFVICLLQFALQRDRSMLQAPMLTRPLLFLALVVIITARLNGTVGVRALGGDVYGGRRYFQIIGAILGYFVLASRTIPKEKATLYVILFFAGTATLGIGNLAGMVSSSFYFLFLIFPVENLSAFTNDVVGSEQVMSHSMGTSMLGAAVFWIMLAKYGVRGVLSLDRPLRFFCFLAAVGVSMYGGFRSTVILLGLTFAVLFYLEGLLRTRWLPAVASVAILMTALAAGFATKLPLEIQRALSFLPIEVSPIAKMSAQTSSEWRLQMWKEVIPDIPQYLIVGKGYAINGSELEMVRSGFRTSDRAAAELAGDYHNGPLSVIIPLGIFGVIAFLWLLWAGARALYQNYRRGDPELAGLNRFLLAAFVAKALFFLTVFGGFYNDLAWFAGIAGLSVSLNGGIAQAQQVPAPQLAFTRFNPAIRRPLRA